MFNVTLWRPGLLIGILAAVGMLAAVACGAAEEATPTPTSTPRPATPTPTTTVPPTATPTRAPGVTPVVATPTPTTAVPPTATPTKGPQPKRGGIVKQSNGIDPVMFNLIDTTSGGTNTHLQKVFSNLIWNPKDDILEPDAAESYKISGDGLTWTFVLRNNVKWHAGTPPGPRDGTLMTAKDVEYSLEKMLGLVDEYVSPRCGWMKEFVDTSRPDKGVAVVDGRTVEVHMKQPFTAFGNLLATGFCALVPDGTTRDMMTKRTYGSGPFVIKSFQRGASWIYGRNEEYFKPGLPYLDEIHEVVIKGTEVTQSALLTRQIDMTTGWPTPDNKPLYQKLLDQGNIKVLPYGTGCRPQGVLMNAARPPFDNLKLRQAINLGIDREGYTQVVHLGYASPSLVLETAIGWGRTVEEISKMPGWRTPHDADLAEAQRIIKEEFPKGLKIEVTVESPAGYMRQGEYISGELTKLGIKNTVNVVDTSLSHLLMLERNYSIMPYWYCQVTGTPEELFGSYFLTSGSRNTTGYSNPALDAGYLDMAGTTDLTERKRKALALEDMILKDLPYAPLPVHTSARYFYSYVQDVFLAITSYNWSKAERIWRSDI